MGVNHRSPHDEYYTVDIIPRRRQDIQPRAFHDRLEGLRGKMMLHIEALSQVFVGTGDYETDAEGIYQTFARTGNKLVIPGTTIKGVVRTYAEALSQSCEGGQCVLDKGGLCICCSIFGALGFQGRISFSDAAPNDPGIPTGRRRMRVRWGGGFQGGRRFYYHGLPGDYRARDEQTSNIITQNEERVETVPERALFTCEAFFENLTEQEMGLVLLAMGCSPDHQFHLKMGGGKNRRLGSIALQLPDGVDLLTSNSYDSFHSKPQTRAMSEWGKSAVAAYLEDLPSEVREMAHDNCLAFQRDAVSARGDSAEKKNEDCKPFFKKR